MLFVLRSRILRQEKKPTTQSQREIKINRFSPRLEKTLFQHLFDLLLFF